MRSLACLLLCFSLPAAAADLTVSAAASLRDAFGDIAAAYQRQYPDARIRLNSAASGTLVQQLLKGAPVDVLATADEDSMNRAAAAIDPSTRRLFARNTLVLIAPVARPLHPAALGTLATPTVRRIAVGRPESVPAGRYARAALQQQGLLSTVRPKLVYTQNVRQALDYVARGEADAGLVYRTDALAAANKVRVAAAIATPQAITYPVAVSARSRQRAEAKRFAAYLHTPAARRILQQHGFDLPR